MKELQRRQKIKKALYSLPSLVLLMVIAVLMARGALGMVGRQLESGDRVAELQAEAEALNKRSQDLEARIARLDTEEGVMDEIKEKFNVSMEGEHLAILVDEPITTEMEEKDEKNWYEKLVNFLSRLWP